MHQRLQIIFASLVGIGGAQAAVAPSANALAECRLEFSVAQGEMKKLKVTKQTDDSGAEYDDVTTEYDPSKLRAFGLKATRFLFNEYADEGGVSHTVQTEFALPYDAARPKLLKAWAIGQCVTTDPKTVSQRCRLFLKKNDGGKHALLAELMPTRTGGSQFECTYLD